MFDVEMAHRFRARLEKGRARQAKHRANNRAERRPERDDVANAALRLLLDAAMKHPDRAGAWVAAIASDLAGLEQPFDMAKTTAVVEGMVERHRETVEREVRRRAAERGDGA